MVKKFKQVFSSVIVEYGDNIVFLLCFETLYPIGSCNIGVRYHYFCEFLNRKM